MQNVIVVYTSWPCTLVSNNNRGDVCAEPGRAGREKTTLRVKSGGKRDGGRWKKEGKKQEGAEILASLSVARTSDPLPPLPPPSSKSMLSVLYKSWCLFLRELLRVVTMLGVSSASPSSFASRTWLKNPKMESKLIQEVNSCLSVPTCKKDKNTWTCITIRTRRVHWNICLLLSCRKRKSVLDISTPVRLLWQKKNVDKN